MFNKKIILVLSLLPFAITNNFGQTSTLPPAAQEAISKGIVAAKIPDYPLAVTYFQEARKAAPQSAEIFFNLGLAESNIPGRELRAICWFGAYLAANPTAANTAAVIEQINALDVKNRSSVIRLINMVQDAAVQISGKDEGEGLRDVVSLWVSMDDLPAATKAANLINKKNIFIRGYALGDIAGAQLALNDIEGAKRTTSQITSALLKCQELVFIANYQLSKGDTGAAQKTLADAFNAGIHIHNDPGYGITTMQTKETEQLYRVANAQATANDIPGAQKTFNTIKELEEKYDKKYYSKIAFAPDKVILLSAIFLAQKMKGDNEGAQKTFSEAYKAFETIDTGYKLSKDWATKSIAKAQAKAGDITSAQKTAELIHDPESICYVQLTIGSMQMISGDKPGAQKSLATAQMAVELIKESYNKVGALAAIAELLAKSGDTGAAKKVLAVAQDTADLIQDEFWKSYSNRMIAEAYKENGIIKIITIADWIKKLDGNNETDDCALNREVFLDLDNYLKTLVRSDDAKDIFTGLNRSAEKIINARNIILQLLKAQAGK